MKDIKFRAWNKLYGMMGEVIAMYFSNAHYEGCNVKYSEDNIGVETKDKISLMQYTGFKDKNGKEIYEGDILKGYCYPFMSGDKTWYVPKGEKPRYNYFLEICWSDELASFCGVHRTARNVSARASADISDYLECFDFSKMEVIGNIYENPELLEEATDGR